MKKIPFTTKLPNKSQCVFLALAADDSHPWEDYTENIYRKDLTIPRILMLNRADGYIGFFGGRVDEGEMLEEAIRREALEEIGYVLDTRYDLIPVIAHELDTITTHLFMQKLPFTLLNDIHRQSIQAKHYGSELTGTFLPHLFDYEKKFGKGGGIVKLLQNFLVPSVREELVNILLALDIFTVDELSDICLRAGYKLSMLLQ